MQETIPTIHNRVSAAKEIRSILKKKFPTTKFSVTSQSYSGGCSIDVRWNLGPTSEVVDRIISKYQYGSFDGMTDSYTHEDTLVLREGGEIAHLGGAKYVHGQREYRTEEEIENSKIGWGNPGYRDLYKEEKSFYHVVGRDICKAAGIEYQSLDMTITNDQICCRTVRGYGNNMLRDIVYQTIKDVDFQNGYHGIKNAIGEGGVKIGNLFIAY